MKLQSILIAAALGLASSSPVFATWLQVSPGHSWLDYCGNNPTQRNTRHVCFFSAEPVEKTFKPSSQFRAYLSPTLKEFVVVLDTDKTATIDSTLFQITMTVQDANCVQVSVNGPENSGYEFDHPVVCLPNPQHIQLPTDTYLGGNPGQVAMREQVP